MLRLTWFKDIPVESASPEKRILEERVNYSIVIKGGREYKSLVVWLLGMENNQNQTTPRCV